MKYLIAGGAVRDLLLGLPLRDVDVLFDGAEQEFIQANLRARKVGDMPHPVYILDGCEFSPMDAGGLEADMLRRDFTINALALEANGVLHAHPQTFSDLERKVIRPASANAIADDPIRAFRAARLAATLPDFTLHPDSLAQMRGLSREALSSIAAEQVGKETLKACRSAKPGNFLRALAAGDCRSGHRVPFGPRPPATGFSPLVEVAQ